jgi:Subtilase family
LRKALAAAPVVLLLGLAAVPTALAAPLVPRDLSTLRSYDESLVQLERGHSAASEQTLRKSGATLVSRRQRLWRVPSKAAQRLVPRFAVTGDVTEVEPDYLYPYKPDAVTVEPLAAQEWWLSHVGADRAEAPGAGKPLTVVDAGLDLSHPEFAGRPDTLALNRQTTTGGQEFHGTAVSSVAAAPVNDTGLVGVYPAAKLNSWDASPDSFLSSSEVIQGIETATSLGPGVINLSLGSPVRSRFESNAILDAYGRGSIVVAAAGNDGESRSPLSYPANDAHVITVGSTNETDAVSSFSSRTWAMDVAAPGENIPAAVPTSFTPTGYATVDGTSFSAPIVSGALAWIWTVRGDLDNTQLFELIRTSARDVGAPGRDPETGFGIIDIPAALAAPAPSRDPLEPNDAIDQVAAGGLFSRAKAPLTAPGRRSRTISARLDAVDDPRDVYRVWVPARSRVTATLRTPSEVQLARQGTRPVGLTATSTRRSTGVRVVTMTNRAARGQYTYVTASIKANAPVSYTSYTLKLTTSAAPKQ